MLDAETLDQLQLMFVLVGLLILLVWGRWRYDVVALGALFTAALFGLVPQSELFAGFGNPATITVVLVLIVSFGLSRSGAVEFVTSAIEPLSSRPSLHIAVLSFIAAFLSMFMNNVGALALLMPIAIQSTNKAGRSPASVLMPLSFGSILGGLVTLIGTPPNILIANYREEVSGQAFAMFDFAPVGGGVALAGILFMLVFGSKLVRIRKQASGSEGFDIERYLFEAKVADDSDFIGQPVGELKDALEAQKMDLVTLQSRRQVSPVVNRQQLLRVGDILVLQGSQEDIDSFTTEHKFALVSAENSTRELLHSADSQMLEIVVTPRSPLVGRTPAEVRFNRRYGINLLAASRSGTPHRSRLRDFAIRVGDVLLLHGEEEALEEAIAKLACYPLATRSLDLKRGENSLPALIIFVTAIVATAVGLMSIQLALGLACVAMALRSIVPVRELYDGVGMACGSSFRCANPVRERARNYGCDSGHGRRNFGGGREYSPVILLTLILVVTMTVSDVLNNAATAILMAPIAYNIATTLGLNPDTFLMAVAVGASCAFLTPIGHQNNALIMGPGGYEFGDYWRVGLPLEVVIVAAAIPLLLLAWPLAG
jgi:di/tricarboxylate transporter